MSVRDETGRKKEPSTFTVTPVGYFFEDTDTLTTHFGLSLQRPQRTMIMRCTINNNDERDLSMKQRNPNDNNFSL